MRIHVEVLLKSQISQAASSQRRCSYSLITNGNPHSVTNNLCPPHRHSWGRRPTMRQSERPTERRVRRKHVGI